VEGVRIEVPKTPSGVGRGEGRGLGGAVPPPQKKI